MDTKYTRRALLNRIGGTAAVAALTPFLPYTEAEAQGAKRTRYLPMFTCVVPNSRLANAALSNSNAEVSDIAFRGAFKDLNTVSSKISMYRGLTNLAAEDGGISGGHGNQAASMLTGVPATKNNYARNPTSNIRFDCGIGTASSLDQWLREKLRERGLEAEGLDLSFGWGKRQVDDVKTFSYKKGFFSLFNEDPKKLFDKMLARASAGGSVGNSTGYPYNVLDYVYEDLDRVKKSLSAVDKRRLDQHLDAINTLRATLDVPDNPDDAAIDLNVPDSVLADTKGTDKASQAFIKLAAIAFNADLTRVISSQWSGDGIFNSISAFNLGNLKKKVNKSYHEATHGNGGTQKDLDNFIRGVQRFRAKCFVDTVNELDKFEDPNGGTLLDSTIAHWFCEHTRDHTNTDSFNIIGGGGGYFKMGKQFLIKGNDKRDAKYPQNMMLVSIANAMGFDIDRFGDNKYQKGPIPSKYLA